MTTSNSSSSSSSSSRKIIYAKCGVKNYMNEDHRSYNKSSGGTSVLKVILKTQLLKYDA